MTRFQLLAAILGWRLVEWSGYKQEDYLASLGDSLIAQRQSAIKQLQLIEERERANRYVDRLNYAIQQLRSVDSIISAQQWSPGETLGLIQPIIRQVILNSQRHDNPKSPREASNDHA